MKIFFAFCILFAFVNLGEFRPADEGDDEDYELGSLEESSELLEIEPEPATSTARIRPTPTPKAVTPTTKEARNALEVLIKALGITPMEVMALKMVSELAVDRFRSVFDAIPIPT